MTRINPNIIHAMDAQILNSYIKPCPRCNTLMTRGLALEHDSASLRPKQRGQGYFPRSDGTMILVSKCPSCGHTTTPGVK